MPPITLATLSPLRNSPPGASSTSPTASMPMMRGNLTPRENPCRVNNSDRFSPTARTRMSTWPGCGVGIGRSWILRTSGPPGVYITAAFIVPMETLEDWSACGLLALRVGRGKAVAGNFELAVPIFAENEKLLVRFRACCAGGVIKGCAGRVCACKHPIRAHLHNLSGLELHRQLDRLKHCIVGFPHCAHPHRRRAVRRHEDAVFSVERHHRIGVGSIQRGAVRGQNFCYSLFVRGHGS